jgi:hypothetical protein
MREERTLFGRGNGRTQREGEREEGQDGKRSYTAKNGCRIAEESGQFFLIHFNALSPISSPLVPCWSD